LDVWYGIKEYLMRRYAKFPSHNVEYSNEILVICPLSKSVTIRRHEISITIKDYMDVLFKIGL